MRWVREFSDTVILEAMVNIKKLSKLFLKATLGLKTLATSIVIATHASLQRRPRSSADGAKEDTSTTKVLE